MPIYTIYPEDFGSVGSSDSTWSGARNGSGTLFASSFSADAATTISIGTFTGASFDINRGAWTFDLSAVAGTVTAASLASEITNHNVLTNFSFNVVDKTGTLNFPITTADWSDLAPGGTTVCTLSATTGGTSNGPVVFSNTSSNLVTAANSRVGGDFVLCITSSRDRASAETDSQNFVEFSHTGTETKLTLTVPTSDDWSFVGVSNSVVDTTGDITLVETGISGLQAGDLLVAAISYRSNTAIGLPSGWAAAATAQNSGNTTVNTTGSISSGVLAYIVRGSSAPALTFTRTGGDLAIGRIYAYRRTGVVGIALDQSASSTLGAANTAVSQSGFTTSKANELVVMAAMTARSTTVSAFDAATNPATASGATDANAGLVVSDTWTERSDDGSTSGADGGLAFADAVKSTAGATGNLSYTAGASARHVIMAASFNALSGGPPFARNAFQQHMLMR